MLGTFPGRLVRPDFAAEVVSPPYDGWTPQQRAHHVATHPLSYLGVTRSPADAPDLTDDELVDVNRRTLSGLIDAGVYGPPRRGLMLYEMTQGSHRQIGIVAEIDAGGSHDGRIVPHEQTRTDRAEQMARHLDTVGAWSSPVAVTYRADPQIDEVVSALSARDPDVAVLDHHGSDHRIWQIVDPAEIDELTGRFRRGIVYVVDGHHRLAAAQHSARSPSLIAVLFPHDQLRIRAFHRVVRDVDTDAVLAGLGPFEPLRPGQAPLPGRAGEVVVVIGKDSYRLTLPELPGGSLVDQLDVTRLQRGLLEPLLGVSDLRTDPRIEHVPAAAGVERLRIIAGADGVAFVLHPMSLDDLLAVADAGEAMPPKSSSFEPKTRSGLFVRLLDDR